MMKREISYILQYREDEPEFCTRYLFYRNANVFRQNLVSSIPFRIDIGAEFNLHLKNREAKIALTAMRREYVIDIDMNDYDGIRTCCSGKKLCNSCWTFMEAAYKVLREVLYEIFGFNKILWVFSGRRGMHAWVCDQEAMGMESYERKSITNYLNVTVNNDKSDRLVIQESLSKMEQVHLFKICQRVLLPYEGFIFGEQNFLGHPKKGEENFKRILTVLKRHYKEAKMNFGDGEIYKKARDSLKTQNYEKEGQFSSKLFETMLMIFNNDIKDQESKRDKTDKIRNNEVELTKKFKFEVIVGLLYPKIDSAVSSHTNHLLKAPFNIHSSSLLLSVPVDPENFDIKKIPSIQDIISGKASLKEYLQNFRGFVNSLKVQVPEIEKTQIAPFILGESQRKKIHA